MAITALNFRGNAGPTRALNGNYIDMERPFVTTLPVFHLLKRDFLVVDRRRVALLQQRHFNF